MTTPPVPPEQAEATDPEHASADRAAEPPAQPDAEQMEAAMREKGFLVTDDPAALQARRELPTEDGPGTSLT